MIPFLKKKDSGVNPEPSVDEEVSVQGVLPLPKTQAEIIPLGLQPRIALPTPSTTRQTEVLNTAVIGSPTDEEGILIGQDRLSGSMVCHDPFTAYEKGEVTSPHVVILGMIGTGKSSLMKTVYGMRQLALKKRRLVYIDKKTKAGASEGEYSELLRWYGVTPFTAKIDGDGGGGGTRLNPLDPVITKKTDKKTPLRLLMGLTEIARDSHTPLNPWEQKAMRLAAKQIFQFAETENRVPLMNDLVPLLGKMDTPVVKNDPLLADATSKDLERLHESGLGLRFTLEAVVLEELSGLFDGPTSPWVDLDDTRPLTSFDVSQLPEEGPAIPMVIAVAHSWLLGMCRTRPGWQTTFGTDEGWHIVTGPTGALMKSTSKLGRSLGVSNVIGLHRPGDIPPDSPGIGLLLEAETIHIYRQQRSIDIDAVMSLYDLQAGSKETLKSLRKGEHLLKVSNKPEIQVKHILSRVERELIDTDQGMVLESL
ncbi:ATP/GTP-binding protein [Dermatophilus congolensis]|uniref:ATP/GTP-binding protein n=1 Tax=Dermatophilus congolensis TaxID=1863 RepID=UPI001AAE5D23|nr:ATP/GTP-binding protein [Dermatophilus congolensis]MBO3146360.1 ATP/GTP-binding protein [Dermatophilus congolensis]MBO3148597.1 ATP/GTP-binding protein [Dermatophilus congolensis]MBO3157597.1 ATP/GTP-binding protein [Dermatophilus congolensis]MBO3159877.1 ATP/GTP-binding protein [Dermatophilus congolensis]MBO3166616.1 ATP/GTP-binding protein [Dermatophilus congolensis]